MSRDSDLPAEAVERRDRSNARLKAENVPVYDDLFVIETADQMHRRTTGEIARRALSLAVVAIHADAKDQIWTNELIESYGIKSDLSPIETNFIAAKEIDIELATSLSWRFEAMMPLLWAIGYVPELSRPDHQIVVPEVLGPIIKFREGELERLAKLRSVNELLDAADLILRYHWAIRDCWLSGRPPPAGLDSGVVAERHVALNWLIRNERWDDVDTGT